MTSKRNNILHIISINRENFGIYFTTFWYTLVLILSFSCASSKFCSLMSCNSFTWFVNSSICAFKSFHYFLNSCITFDVSVSVILCCCVNILYLSKKFVMTSHLLYKFRKLFWYYHQFFFIFMLSRTPPSYGLNFIWRFQNTHGCIWCCALCWVSKL